MCEIEAVGGRKDLPESTAIPSDAFQSSSSYLSRTSVCVGGMLLIEETIKMKNSFFSILCNKGQILVCNRLGISHIWLWFTARQGNADIVKSSVTHTLLKNGWGPWWFFAIIPAPH
ncbi:unnamed protein product [Lathyrus oleraceus]